MGKVHQDQLKELERRYLVLSAVIATVLQNTVAKQELDKDLDGIWVRLNDVLLILNDIAIRPVGHSNMEEMIKEYVGRF